MVHIFVINPFAGQHTFASDLRAKLSTFENLQYFIFNTRNEGTEPELIKRILRLFEGEKLRFYCCGGSGTMRNILNGFDDLSDVEIAFYPCGLTNDFLAVFDENREKFNDIGELINGEVVDIDYIWTNHGIALNTVSTGLDSISKTTMDHLRTLRFMHQGLPYMLSIVVSLFASKALEYTIMLDDEQYCVKSSEIFFGNGYVLGGNLNFADNACVTDGYGLARVSLIKKRGIRMISLLISLIKKNFVKASRSMNFSLSKTMVIKRSSDEPFTVNQDGELIRGVTELKAQIVRQGLHFVVPKGVRP